MTSFKELTDFLKNVEKTSSKKTKVILLAEFLKRLDKNEIAIAVRLLSGKIFPEYSNLSLGVGWATIQKVLKTINVCRLFPYQMEMSIKDVYTLLEKIAKAKGEGSRTKKEMYLRSLILSLSREEIDFLLRIIFGEVRIGASEGILLEAVAEASNCTIEEIRRAYMFLSDLGDVAEAAITRGRIGINQVSLKLFRPVKPMLADMAYSVSEALKEHGGITALEYKYDGIRVQIHSKSGKIKVFSRRLSNITDNVPDIVRAIEDKIKGHDIVVDGEAIGTKGDKPVPFQDIVRRVQRKNDLFSILRELPLRLYLFDILFLDGKLLVDEPYRKRWEILERIVGEDFLAKRLVVSSRNEGEKFFQEAINEGHEGVVAKKLDSVYEPGCRGKKWLKIKEFDTIDCVIVAAEWGHGRRTGWLSDYYLAVLNEETGEFEVVGKTFKGLTDREFEEMTKRLLELRISEREYVVKVKPQIVVEVAYSEIQKSPKYRSGLALRFARITRIRWDKNPYEITTLNELWDRYRKQFERKAGINT